MIDPYTKEKMKQLAVHEEFTKHLKEIEMKTNEILELIDEASKISGSVMEIPKDNALLITLSAFLDTFAYMSTRKFGADIVKAAIVHWYRSLFDPVLATFKMLRLPEAGEILREAEEELGDSDDGRTSE